MIDATRRFPKHRFEAEYMWCYSCIQRMNDFPWIFYVGTPPGQDLSNTVYDQISSKLTTFPSASAGHFIS